MNIKKKIEDLQQQGLNSNCYYLINSKDMLETIKKCNDDHEKLKYFYDLCKGWDNSDNAIPLEIGVSLEELIKDPNVRVGIHRSSAVTGIDDEILKNIMTIGLRNNGQIFQGVTHEIPGLTKTISFVNNMIHTIPMLKSSYKGSNGAIIFNFPANYLDSEGNIVSGFENQIYQECNGSYYVRPEFIVGYLVSEYGVYNLYTRQDILNKGDKLSD